LTAKSCSKPSSVSRRLHENTPALLTRMSKRLSTVTQQSTCILGFTQWLILWGFFTPSKLQVPIPWLAVNFKTLELTDLSVYSPALFYRRHPPDTASINYKLHDLQVHKNYRIRNALALISSYAYFSILSIRYSPETWPSFAATTHGLLEIFCKIIKYDTYT